MPKRMLIDASHKEETRVAVVDHQLRLHHLDIVHEGREPLKGNIYLAKVKRIEPSLQAAFVEYGGNRHGFLPFAEIHPDYFRIPVADKEALMKRITDAEAKLEQEVERRSALKAQHAAGAAAVAQTDGDALPFDPFQPIDFDSQDDSGSSLVSFTDTASYTPEPVGGALDDEIDEPADTIIPAEEAADARDEDDDGTEAADDDVPSVDDENYETVGGDDESGELRRRVRRQFLRNYRIQEVIKRGQVMLIQVVKEERGNKGAALTSYMSLAGRYCVLMPNSDKSGGVSRKISNTGDRRRLKEIIDGLDVPDGMSVILRTAGVERTNEEIKRDFDYLVRQWNNIREQTLQSTAPALIYEEANLLKRSLRDYYDTNSTDAVVVEGDEGYKLARDFMGVLMPEHVDRVVRYENPDVSLFARYQIENQIEKLYQSVVQLKSGGYIVINPTEALVSIDVNSGRATKDRHIEETALRTNLEASDEIARQLRLRDLAGLVVVDYIDMEEYRHNHQVERRLKEAMKHDRARLQIGRISPFGLMELSRQRLRPSLLETNYERCTHCAGAGHVRSTDSAALSVIRAVAEEGVKQKATEIAVFVPTAIATYILNHKRNVLEGLEKRFGMNAVFKNDDTLSIAEYRIERRKAREGEKLVQVDDIPPSKIFVENGMALGITPLTATETNDAAPTAPAGDDGEEGNAGGGNRRGRNRRRRPRKDRPPQAQPAEGEAAPPNNDNDAEGDDDNAAGNETQAADGEGNSQQGQQGDRQSRRRRGRRGGRNRNRQQRNGQNGEQQTQGQQQGPQQGQQPNGNATQQQGGRPPREGRGQHNQQKPMPVHDIDTTPKSAGDDKSSDKGGWWRRWTS